MLRLKCGNVSKDARIGVPPFYARAHTRSARQRWPQPPKKMNENHEFDRLFSRKKHVKTSDVSGHRPHPPPEAECRPGGMIWTLHRKLVVGRAGYQRCK